MYRDRLTELKGNRNYDQVDSYGDRYNGRSRNNGGGSYNSRNNGGSYNSRNNEGGSYNSRNNEGSSYSSRNNGGHDGYSPVNRHGSPPDSPPGYSRNQGNDVASRFSGRINNINHDTRALWDYVDKLDSLYNRNYNEVRRAENVDITKRINELEGRINAEIQKIANQLKIIKAEGERITNPRDRKMVLIQVSNASNNLKKLFDTYSDKRIRNEEQNRNKMVRQYQIVNKNATREEAERYIDSHPGGSLQYSMLSGSKQAYDEAQQRHDQIEQINRSINELCDLFQNMNNMLETQNETINVIEDNVNEAEYCVEDASKELTEAVKIRKRSRKLLWIITIIIFVLILLFVCIYVLPNVRAVVGFFNKIFGKDDKDNKQNNPPEPAPTAVSTQIPAPATQDAFGQPIENQQQQQQQQQ